LSYRWSGLEDTTLAGWCEDADSKDGSNATSDEEEVVDDVRAVGEAVVAGNGDDDVVVEVDEMVHSQDENSAKRRMSKGGDNGIDYTMM
jgi:hypothetical protein